MLLEVVEGGGVLVVESGVHLPLASLNVGPVPVSHFNCL